MRSFFDNLLRSLGPVLLVAGLAGVFLGRHYIDGFPLLLLETVRRTWRVVLVALVVFLALFEVFDRLARRRLSERPARWIVVALAGAPLVAWAGVEWNRLHDVRPSELLETYGLKVNLGLLAGCGVALLVMGLALRSRRLDRRPQRPPAAAVLAAVAVAAVLALEGGLTWAFRAPAAVARPDVFIVLIDALRADRLSCYGHHRDTSPAIDRLAADGVLFRNAISQSTFTKTSVSSLFTGRNPYRHGVYWGNRERPGAITSDVLSGDETTLAEALSDGGYLTAAWVQNTHLRSFMGFAQGFTEYHDQQGDVSRLGRRFRDWLGAAVRYDAFAYLHLIDLHDPYRPKPPWDTRYGTFSDVYAGVDFARWGDYLRAVRDGEVVLSEADVAQLEAFYDGQLRYLDEHLGRLFAELRRRGLYDPSLIVVTADHGDAFLEHGFISHSTLPYDELVKVPLILKLPGGRLAGTVVEDQVRLIDVLPTVLDAVGLEPPRRTEIDGCSLLPLLAAPGEGRDRRCTEAVTEIAEEGGYPSLALRTGRRKYIHREHAADELYDLEADPGETTNLVASRADEAAAFEGRALAMVARRPAPGEQLELDERMIRQLEALGYVQGRHDDTGDDTAGKDTAGKDTSGDDTAGDHTAADEKNGEGGG